MNKRLVSIISGLTLLGTIQSASATSNVTATNTPTSVTAPTVTVNQTSGEISPDVGTTIGTAAQGIMTNTVTTAGTNAIQSGNRTLTTAAAQQTAGISAALSKIPFCWGDGKRVNPIKDSCWYWRFNHNGKHGIYQPDERS